MQEGKAWLVMQDLLKLEQLLTTKELLSQSGWHSSAGIEGPDEKCGLRSWCARMLEKGGGLLEAPSGDLTVTTRAEIAGHSPPDGLLLNVSSRRS
jgi:hypothetical protein